MHDQNFRGSQRRPAVSSAASGQHYSREGTPSPRAWRLSAVAAYLVFLLVLAELFAWPAGKLLQAKWWMYRDPSPGPNAISLTEYLAFRDPLLGWPAKREFGERYTPEGARWCKGTELRAGAEPLASLYGDSFTADWVGGDTDHWGCRMQRRLAAPVKNYGVGGYGTDQSLLRYRNNTPDSARIVILGHMSENIARNLTRYRDFHTRSQDWAFKPRFVLDDAGALSLVPIPTLNDGEYRRFIGAESPRYILPHENFAPGGPAGAVRHDFPHLVALLRNFGHWEVRARLAGLPTYGPLYDPGHPLKGLQLTTAIMLAFEREAGQRGQKALLIIFPGPGDVDHYRKTGKWLYHNLIEALRDAGAQPYNFGETLLDHYGKRPVESIFRDHHYTQEVSHLVADGVTAQLASRGWLNLEAVARH
jgi:hypothetical protein